MRLDEAYQQQLGHWRTTLASGAHRIGWKVGFNAPELQERLGIAQPVVGNLTTATLIGADGSHSLAGAESPLVEPEIAIEMGPGGSVAGLGPAVEVIDMDGLPDDVGDAVAGNIFHRAVAIGSSKGSATAQGMEARVSVNGELRESAHAGAADLDRIIELVDSTLRSSGESLDAGDRIIAGSLTTPVSVRPGDRVAVDLGPLGGLELDFTV